LVIYILATGQSKPDLAKVRLDKAVREDVEVVKLM
jgi:hypothetical protein